MSLKKGHKGVTVTLNKLHQEKLKELMVDTGLSATGVIQRLLEGSIMVQVKK